MVLLKEFPLNSVPCVMCGQPGLAFVPPRGIKHRYGWCRVGYVAAEPGPLTPPHPSRTSRAGIAIGAP